MQQVSTSQQHTRYAESMLARCYSIACNVSPARKQHRVNVPYLLFSYQHKAMGLRSYKFDFYYCHYDDSTGIHWSLSNKSFEKANKLLTNSQDRVFKFVCQDHNLVICGQAGTGKTFLLTNIARKLIELQNNVAFTCTTGMACYNFNSVFCCWF